MSKTKAAGLKAASVGTWILWGFVVWLLVGTVVSLLLGRL